MIRSRIYAALLAALLLVAVPSCSTDSLTGVPTQETASAPASPSLTPSASLLGGLLNTLGGTINTVSTTLNVPIVSPLLSDVSGLLVTCTPQKYASTTQWVGPYGGTLYIGQNELVI
ncbi:MAG TPA: hypothetical protein VFJ96_05325, partial [Gemmatimonadaceae bacterium]|nr:hypothetical protein [Gemmatimonadaceae bacterium]